MKNRDFFETYADEYDILTNAKAREEFHQSEIKKLIEVFKPKSVLDAGCATGLSAFLIAKSGIKAIGLDRSRPMLKQAKLKYGKGRYDLTFRYGNFEKLPKTMFGKFDLVVCLANSISGVGTMNNLIRTLNNFYLVLKPEGALVLQMLNYQSLKDGDFFPIKATKNGDIVYQRFSERKGKRLFIYINRLDLSKTPLKYEMFRHEFENFAPDEMTSAMKKTGFRNLKRYADLKLNKKFTKTSRDLVLTAVK